jgi:hypothetical protein
VYYERNYFSAILELLVSSESNIHELGNLEIAFQLLVSLQAQSLQQLILVSMYCGWQPANVEV